MTWELTFLSVLAALYAKELVDTIAADLERWLKRRKLTRQEVSDGTDLLP